MEVERSLKATFNGSLPLRGVAEKLATGGGLIPIPLKVISTVDSSGSFDGIDKVADLAPVEVGLKTTSSVAEDAGASVCPEQLSFCLENWSASVPFILMEPIFRFKLPSLVTVTVFVELDEPISTELKSVDVGLTVMSGWAVTSSP